MSIALVILSYLLGSISFGYIIAKKVKKVDIRKVGSGNAGATNISRALGFKFALVVFLLDVGKGLLAVLLAAWLTSNPWTIIFCAYAVICGHNWPIFFSFKGGRGSATTLGVFLGIMPVPALIVFVIIVVIILTTRYVSLASLREPFHPSVYLSLSSHGNILFSVCPSSPLLFAHIPNIKRLLGKRTKFGEKADITPKGRR